MGAALRFANHAQRLKTTAAEIAIPIDTDSDPRAYDILKDRIRIPPVGTFHSTSKYYGPHAHECAHATGHKSRLDRFSEKRPKTSCAEEELVAEIASAMLGSLRGFEPDFEQDAAYIKHWVDAMKADNRAIFKAAAAAQKAVDFINAVATDSTYKQNPPTSCA